MQKVIFTLKLSIFIVLSLGGFNSKVLLGYFLVEKNDSTLSEQKKETSYSNISPLLPPNFCLPSSSKDACPRS